MTITSEEARAREVLAREYENATDAPPGAGQRFHAANVRVIGKRDYADWKDRAAIRAMLAFAHQSPSRAAGEDDPLSSYEKFDGVGPHAETIETRARIGESYLEAYESALTDPLIAGYTPADCPSELLLDLLERLRTATPHPVTGNDELPGREGAFWARLCYRADYDGQSALTKPNWPDPDRWEMKSAMAQPYLRMGKAIAAVLATPAELPALPSREEIARIVDPRIWELRDEDRQRDRADWEHNVKPGWGDISFEQWATRGLESSLAKADAILSLFAALHPPASVAEVEADHG